MADRSFQGVHRLLMRPELVGDRGEEALRGEDGGLAGVVQHEAAGPVGVLDLPGVEAAVAHESCLLVPSALNEKKKIKKKNEKELREERKERKDSRIWITPAMTTPCKGPLTNLP